MNGTKLSADCVGASSVNMYKSEIDAYLTKGGVHLDG